MLFTLLLVPLGYIYGRKVEKGDVKLTRRNAGCGILVEILYRLTHNGIHVIESQLPASLCGCHVEQQHGNVSGLFFTSSLVISCALLTWPLPLRYDPPPNLLAAYQSNITHIAHRGNKTYQKPPQNR